MVKRLTRRARAVRRAAAMTAVGALVLSPGLIIDDVRAESLKETVEDALAYHPRIFRDQALSVAADHAIEEAYSNFLPSVDLQASSGGEATNNPTTRVAGRGTVALHRSEFSVTVRQLLFDFHETANRVASARSGLTASNAVLQASGDAIARLAAGFYIDILEARERAAFAQDNVADLAEIVDLIRGRTSAGRAAEADLDQAVSRLALAQADLIATEGEEREATSRYIENIGRPPGPLIRPDEPDYAEASDLGAALATAMDRNPSVHATAYIWEARKSDIEVARAAFFPEFAVQAEGSWGENLDGVRGDNTSLSLLLTANWNIFNGFGDLGRTRAATAGANAASRDDAEARRLVREAVRVSFHDLQTSKDRLLPLRDDVVSSQTTFDSYLEQFNVGQRSLLDLLDARAGLFGAQEAEVLGLYDVYRAHYDLLFASGLIMESLGIHIFRETGRFQEVHARDARFAPQRDARFAPQRDARFAPDQETRLAPGTEKRTVETPEAEQRAFAEVDWSGEVMLPGTGEFGSWLGQDEQRAVAFGPAGAAATPASPPRTGGEGPRRDIVGFVVETVPAMGDLPEVDVMELPAVALGRPGALKAVSDGAVSDGAGANPEAGRTEDSASAGKRAGAG